MRAYVVLKVSPQHTAGLMQSLKGDSGITQASLIHGPYDCLLAVDGKDLETINETVLRIREREGVLETMTCLVVQSWER
jgi:hypothetical protein